MRPDLKTLKKANCDLKCFIYMRLTMTILFPLKQIGIDVGDHFLTRCEMAVIGLHHHWMHGIQYMTKGLPKKVIDLSTVLPHHHASRIVNESSYLCQVEGKYRNYSFPLAVSIVLSGMYEDNLDMGDHVIYIGQGGNDYKGKCRQTHNQVMARGNLALKKNYEQEVSVRLIRGHTSEDWKPGRTYTYDGLYKVIEYWAEKGASKFTVFKFHLNRIEGQPPLTTKQVWLVCHDISGGQEAIPIPATNLIDPPLFAFCIKKIINLLNIVDEFLKMHAGFKYCKSMELAKNVKLPVRASGCRCEGTCTNPRICDCAKLNGVDFPYVSRDGCRLVVPKSIVHECGPLCGCGDDCANKSSKRGIKYRLEKRIGDSAISSKEESESACLDTGTEDKEQIESKPEFCIDAGEVGNVARFMNHSCDGNLFIQSVLSSHEDIKLARLILFASENIPPLQELTYDYGYEVDSVLNADGSIRERECQCGAANCRRRVC
ncbi:hypothetical protein MKX01_017134 [Papaver californicum]|nr:hypothetical protein MKX01_017134 [Papaver californicum]